MATFECAKPPSKTLCLSPKSGGKRITHYLPFLDWLVHYRRQDFVGDLLAGAARNVGLQSALNAEKPSRTPALVAPFIALMDDGNGIVIEHVDTASGKATIALPPANGDPAVHHLHRLC